MICEGLIEVVSYTEQIFCRPESGPLGLGPGRHGARDWQVSTGHEDLLAPCTRPNRSAKCAWASSTCMRDD